MDKSLHQAIVVEERYSSSINGYCTTPLSSYNGYILLDIKKKSIQIDLIKKKKEEESLKKEVQVQREKVRPKQTGPRERESSKGKKP